MDLPGAWLLLAPAGLLGLLAIAVPVAIHLISHGRGRRVLIGNIELVRAPRKTRVTSIKLTQWLLLLLRILIVAVATLILAQLALQGLGSADAGVRYVTPAWLASATTAEREELFAQEPAVRVLAADYPDASGFTPGNEEPGYTAWPWLAERLSTLRHTGTVEVLAANRMTEFGHARPELPNEVSWNLKAVRRATTPVESQGVVVYDSDRTEDLAQVERALTALRRFRVPALEWASCAASDASCIDGAADWLVWLSDSEPPAGPERRLHRPAGPQATIALSDPRYPDELLNSILDVEQWRIAWQQIPVSADVLAAGAGAGNPVPLPHRSVRLWLGLLLVTLWALERWLSERRGGNDG